MNGEHVVTLCVLPRHFSCPARANSVSKILQLVCCKACQASHAAIRKIGRRVVAYSKNLQRSEADAKADHTYPSLSTEPDRYPVLQGVLSVIVRWKKALPQHSWKMGLHKPWTHTCTSMITALTVVVASIMRLFSQLAFIMICDKSKNQ